MSSCAASSSTCCRAGSTRSATSVCGIPRNTTTPHGCGRCCNWRRHPSLAHHRSLSSRLASTLTQSQCRRSSHGSVHTVIRGGWSSSARSRRTRRNKPWRHDRQRKLPPPLSGLAAACLGTPQRSLVTNGADDPTLLQMTLPIVLKVPLPTAILAVVPRRPAGPSRVISPRSERPW
jgi:hypothetical protein